MAANQAIITGPKIEPMNSVPRRWTMKRPIRIATVSGTTIGDSCGASSFSPSIALNTEMAGVITPSP